MLRAKSKGRGSGQHLTSWRNWSAPVVLVTSLVGGCAQDSSNEVAPRVHEQSVRKVPRAPTRVTALGQGGVQHVRRLDTQAAADDDAPTRARAVVDAW